MTLEPIATEVSWGRACPNPGRNKIHQARARTHSLSPEWSRNLWVCALRYPPLKHLFWRAPQGFHSGIQAGREGSEQRSDLLYRNGLCLHAGSPHLYKSRCRWSWSALRSLQGIRLDQRVWVCVRRKGKELHNLSPPWAPCLWHTPNLAPCPLWGGEEREEKEQVPGPPPGSLNVSADPKIPSGFQPREDGDQLPRDIQVNLAFESDKSLEKPREVELSNEELSTSYLRNLEDKLGAAYSG